VNGEVTNGKVEEQEKIERDMEEEEVILLFGTCHSNLVIYSY
jgi:hypothetical protein